MYSYPYPRPSVATDIVAFTLRAHKLAVLLIKRGSEPYAGVWALPGGFLGEDEELDECARRELQEETGVGGVYLEHFRNYSAPSRDPRGRVISVAYLALTGSSHIRLAATTDAAEAQWFELDQVPSLAFDHTTILNDALVALRSRLETNDELFSKMLLSLVPDQFTLGLLQTAYEAVLGRPVDKRNFRSRIHRALPLRETEMTVGGRHRPAMQYVVSDGS